MEFDKTLFMSRLAEILKSLLGLNNTGKQEEKLTLQPDYVKK